MKESKKDQNTNQNQLLLLETTSLRLAVKSREEEIN